MARSLEDILGTLSRSLASRAGSSWSSLVQGIVGRELLYAGANIIYATEQLSDSVNGVLELDRFGLDRLISYAYAQEVPLDLVQPSQIRLRLTPAARERFVANNGSSTLAPFQLSVSLGVLTFYNISYTDISDPVTLYAGSLHSVSSGASALAVPFPGWSASAASGSWRLYLELAQGSYSSAYVKLGNQVVSDSVWVFAQSISGGPVFPYTTYDSALVNPDAKLYKVRMLWDRSTVVLFGDGNWSQEVGQGLYDYTIVWLEAAVQPFTLNGNTVPQFRCRSFRSTSDDVLSGLSFADAFEVLSTRSGQGSSESYARSYLAERLFSKQGLVSEAQIYAYLNTLASVGSSYIESSLDAVDVYIKPTDPTDVGFGFIEEYLYSYGVVGRTYNVQVARPLPFRIQLSSTSSSVAAASAAGVLTALYSYDSVSLDTRLTSAVIQQALSEAGYSGVVATIVGQYVSEGVSSVVRLGALPLMNSIVLKSKDGLLLGFDSNGAFRQYIEGQSASLLDLRNTAYSSYGIYTFVSPYSGESYLYRLDGDRVLMMSADTIIGQHGILTPYGDNLFGLWDSDAGVLYVYVDRSVLHDSSASTGLSMNPTYIAAMGKYSIALNSDSAAVAGTVNLLKVLGVFGSASRPSYLMAAVRWAPRSGPKPSEKGLARYRCVGSSYTFDMMLALSDSGGSFYPEYASYYGGAWYGFDYVAAEGNDPARLYVIMYSDSYVTPATAAESSEAWRLWSRSLRVQGLGTESLLEVFAAASGTRGLQAFKVLSDSLFVVAYLDASDHLKYKMFSYSVAIDTGTQESVFNVSDEGLSDDRDVSDLTAADFKVFPSEGGLQTVISRSGVTTVYEFPGRSAASDEYSTVALLRDTGSVDYSTGVVYGAVMQEGDVMSYTVASVLGDGRSYPYLIGIDN